MLQLKTLCEHEQYKQFFEVSVTITMFIPGCYTDCIGAWYCVISANLQRWFSISSFGCRNHHHQHHHHHHHHHHRRRRRHHPHYDHDHHHYRRHHDHDHDHDHDHEWCLGLVKWCLGLVGSDLVNIKAWETAAIFSRGCYSQCAVSCVAGLPPPAGDDQHSAGRLPLDPRTEDLQIPTAVSGELK